MTLQFEWDEEKAKTNVEKHGASFAEAATVFGDPLAITIEDPDSEGEHRCVTCGVSAAGRLVIVVTAERDHTIRVISAREASRREKKSYEEGQE